ncbi:MAG: efflux RND transporter periplasmic adaptor subunit, partial [Bacteroidales bacterium]|nr:efflux RND transporter periplasmic adaptor subunit [Bacteroidales bacterium]
MNKNVNKLALYTIFLCVGIVLGKILYRPENSLNNSKKGIIAVQENNSTIWTCSMHPQIRMHQPGKCPLCAMDLIPLETSGAVSIDPNAIELSSEAIELANVHTAAVTRAAAEKIIRVYGRAKPNERLIQNLTSPIAGRVETLFVNSAGFSVSKGQLLAYIFS